MYDLLTYLEIAAFVSSIIAWNEIKGSKYMRLFPILLFLIAACELFASYIALREKYNAWFYNICDPIFFLLYFLIIFFSVKNNRLRKIIKSGALLFILISCVSYFFYYHAKDQFNIYMYIGGTIILIIFLIFKIYELMEDPVNLDFLKNPFFYILIFTLLFYVVTIPDFAMDNWMANTKMNRLITIVNNVNDILNMLLYASYTIAFLWIKRTGIY